MTTYYITNSEVVVHWLTNGSYRVYFGKGKSFTKSARLLNKEYNGIKKRSFKNKRGYTYKETEDGSRT